MSDNDIHWHDCGISRVVEIPADARLVFEVDYPVDWERNEFAPHRITFDDLSSHEVHEGPFHGSKTILGTTISEADEHGTRQVRIETNAGYRLIRCKRWTLSRGYDAG